MRLRQLYESKETEVAIIFGRFNPPHKGHRAAWELASQSDHWFVGTNESTQGPKDPLPFDVKIQAMKTIWPEVKGHIVAEQSWLTLASKVYEKFPRAKLLCLTDEDWVTKTIQQYNGKEGPHGFYKFAVIEQKPTPRLSSATALRAAVQAGDRQAFADAAGVPADTEVAGQPFFDLVAEYLLPYAEKEKAKAEKKKKKEVAEGSLNEFAPGGGGASNYYTVTSNFVDDFNEQKEEELQDRLDSGFSKEEIEDIKQEFASDIVYFEQVRDGFLKGLKPGFDAYLRGDTMLKDQLGEYWLENDLPLNQDWEKIYGEPWGDDTGFAEGVVEVTIGDYRKKAQMQKALAQMDQVFGRSPEEKEKAAKIAAKREKGLSRLHSRDEKRAAAAREKSHADALAKDKADLPELKAMLKKLQAEFDPYYDYSDDHSVWTKHKDIAARISGLEKRIARAELAEGLFGLSAKEKGSIQNVTSKLSDIPGMWDHEVQTFTGVGLEQLKTILKDNPKYIKYALNLTADDFDADLDEEATKADADALTKAIQDFQTKAGLKADGVVGPNTAAAIKTAATAQPAQTGASTADPGAPPAQPAAQAAAKMGAPRTEPAAQPAAKMGAPRTEPAAQPAAQAAAKMGAPRTPPATTAPTGTSVTNQQSNTTQQGGTTTTTASANIQGLDMNKARQSPEYQAILKQSTMTPGGKPSRQDVQAADMKYKSAIASGKIKPPAGGATPAPATQQQAAAGGDNF